LPLNVSIADENDSNLRYSEVPLKGKNKTLVKKIGGASTHFFSLISEELNYYPRSKKRFCIIVYTILYYYY